MLVVILLLIVAALAGVLGQLLELAAWAVLILVGVAAALALFAYLGVRRLLRR